MNSIGPLLLRWFEKARRELPWRREPRDPYRVWISEVMLQQTRVEVVIPYYQRFVKRFPTLAALAKAPLAFDLDRLKQISDQIAMLNRKLNYTYGEKI